MSFQSLTAPTFDIRSRVMLIAPHPDDEALACSVILQQAVRAGAAIRVVYVTDGDNNPWPQRALERRWRLSASDRKRWGKLRRSEALAALRVLGIHPSEVQPQERELPLSTADSTGQRNGLTEHLSRRLVAQSLSGSLVQLSRYRVQLGL